MKLIFVIILIAFILIQDSCKKDSSIACGVKNPQENLSWLNQRLDLRSPEPGIIACTEVYYLIFQGKEYISISDCEGAVDGMFNIFDCKGNLTCSIGGTGMIMDCPGMPYGFT